MEKTAQYPIWINGQIQTHVSALDRGFTYGDGVFETLRIHQGRAIFWNQHIQRLQQGLQRLKIAYKATLEDDVQRFLQSVPTLSSAILRITVTRGIGRRGYRSDPSAQPSWVFSLHPLPDRQSWQQGVCVYPCQTPLGSNPALAGMKHLNRLEQVLARAEWQGDEYQEGLMCNSAGWPICGIMSNLFMVHQGLLYTPPLDQSGVAGIARNYILEQASLTDHTGIIRAFSLDTLLQADEVFLCNSVFGVWPVQAYQQHRWSSGPISQHYQSLLNTVIYATL